jgi:hypothetical protein
MSQDGTHASDTNAVLEINPPRQPQQLALAIGGAEILMILFVFKGGGISWNKKYRLIIPCN